MPDPGARRRALRTILSALASGGLTAAALGGPLAPGAGAASVGSVPVVPEGTVGGGGAESGAETPVLRRLRRRRRRPSRRPVRPRPRPRLRPPKKRPPSSCSAVGKRLADRRPATAALNATKGKGKGNEGQGQATTSPAPRRPCRRVPWPRSWPPRRPQPRRWPSTGCRCSCFRSTRPPPSSTASRGRSSPRSTKSRRTTATSSSVSMARDGQLRRNRPRRDEDPGGRSSTSDHEVLGEARLPTPTERRPRGGRRARCRSALRERRPGGRGRAAQRSAGIGVGSPGTIDDGQRHAARATCPTGRAPSRSPTTLEERAGPPRSRRQRRAGRRPTPSSRSAPGAPYRSLLGVFWGTGVGGGLILDGKPWMRPRRRRRDRAHGRQDRRRALHLWAARLHGGLRRARGDGAARAQARREGREHRPVQAR